MSKCNKKKIEKKLTYKEVYEIDGLYHKIEKLRMDIELMKEKKQGSVLKKKVYEFLIKDEDICIKDANKIIDEKNKSIDSIREQSENVIESIRKRLKLSGKFGFDPDTLEVVED